MVWVPANEESCAGIFKQSIGPIGTEKEYRVVVPAHQAKHSLAELFPWNRLLDSLKV